MSWALRRYKTHAPESAKEPGIAAFCKHTTGSGQHRDADTSLAASWGGHGEVPFRKYITLDLTARQPSDGAGHWSQTRWYKELSSADRNREELQICCQDPLRDSSKSGAGKGLLAHLLSWTADAACEQALLWKNSGDRVCIHDVSPDSPGCPPFCLVDLY